MKLAIALVHFNVRYKEVDRNKQELLGLIEQEAQKGTNIILCPEMAISGYSFSSRHDISHYVEDEDGNFIAELKKIATSCNCYICIGLALRDRETDAYTNSAIVVGPRELFFRYDKINGEIRWAQPGNPQQTEYFNTPWGRIGVLICSDTYYGLMPRIAALKGVNLLLVPANWPPSGLDPVELWRARALENGMAIAVCNRTGQDLNMNCEKSESCLIAANGEILFRDKNSESQIFNLSISLDNGLLASTLRKKQLAGRQPEQYHSCYRNLSAVDDLTSFLELPGPDKLSVNCFVQEITDTTFEIIMSFLPKNIKSPIPSLLFLPASTYSDTFQLMSKNFAKEYGIWILFQEISSQPQWHIYDPTGVSSKWPPSEIDGETKYILPQIDIGPARVNLMDYEDLRHPEAALASSKTGCDLIITCPNHFSDETKLICGTCTINHLAVACCTPEGAGIWMRPEGHERWGETLSGKSKWCNFILDTSLTRKKRFQDRIDFSRILNR